VVVLKLFCFSWLGMLIVDRFGFLGRVRATSLFVYIGGLFFTTKEQTMQVQINDTKEIYPHAIEQAIQELYRHIPEKNRNGTIDLDAWEKQDQDHDKQEVLDVAREFSDQMEQRIEQLKPRTQPADSIPTGRSHTQMGTPCSPKWDQDWIDLLEQTEQKVGHRCCGAHAPDEAPCQLESTSKNGRCRFHGGGLNSGAQKGNTNARIHGLYARRIQQCGAHCPQWKTCPYAGDDVKKMPETNRPNCYFEERELKALRQLDATAHETYKPLLDAGRTIHY